MKLSLIDTHQHLWDPARFSYSWMQDLPAIRARRLIEEYRAATSAAVVLASVYVDTDVDDVDRPAEARMIFDLAQNPANRIAGIVASVRPEREGFLDHLRPYLGGAKLKGVRRVLHTQPDPVSQQPLFVAQVRSLAAHQLSFDLCVFARQLPLAVQLVRACPEVSFVLDHCGNPPIRDGAPSAWRQAMATLAAEPNVACKISGLVTCANPAELTSTALRPYVEHVIDCFGDKRVLWGGDWPVCTLTCPLQRWIEITAELLADATPEQREQLLWRNAVRVYRLEEPVWPAI